MTAAALCVRIKRRDGMVLRTTSHDRDITVTAAGYEGTYRTAAALAPSEMQFRASLAVDGMDVTGLLSEATGIPERDIAAGVYDQARVTVFETDWRDPSAANTREWVWGVLGKKHRTEEGRLTLEVRTISQLMNQTQGDAFQRTCRAELGTGSETHILRRCSVDMAAFTFVDDVTGVISARKTLIVAGLVQEAGYFSWGKITWLTGANAGAVREIRRHEDGGILALYDPLPFDIEVGDSVEVQAGCDKTFETCRDKFDNVENFQGEPRIPGSAYMRRNIQQAGGSSPGGQSLLGSLIQFAATAIGSVFGPVGTFVGTLIGAILAPVSGGSAEGPRADDLRVTSSTDGIRIPWVAGRYPVAGNVITDIEIAEEVRTRRVGKNLFSSGTKVTEYFYFFTGFVALGEGPLDVLRIWAYDKLIYDIRPLEERKAEFIARAQELGTEGVLDELGNIIDEETWIASLVTMNEELDAVMTLYRGTEDQEVDPVLAAHYGTGEVPAHKGLAGLLFNRLSLDQFASGAVPPQLKVEVCRPLPEVDTTGIDDENVGTDVLAA